MVAWFIIALATLTIFTLLAVNTVSNIEAANDLVSRAETARRMDAAVNALLAASQSPNGTGNMWLPAGQTSNGSYVLPSNLAQYGLNAVGQQIIYCPFGGGESGTNITVPSVDTSSYTVQVASLNGTNYVVGGRPAYAQVATNPNVLGWLISQRNRNDPIPSCDNVTFNAATNTFQVLNGIVRPIIRSVGTVENREITTRGINWYVSPTGTGSGSTPVDPSSLTTAFNYWRTRQPNSMTVTMASGSYSMPSSYLDVTAGAFSDLGHNTQLNLYAASPNTVTVTQASAGAINMPMGGLSVTNVNFDTGTSFVANNSVTITLTNSAGGAATAQNGGVINISGASLTSTGSVPLFATYGSTVTLQGVNTLVGNSANPLVYANYGSDIIASGSTINGSIASGTSPELIQILNGSTFESKGTTVNINSAFSIAMLVDSSVVYGNSLNFAIAGSITKDLLRLQNGAQVTLINGGTSGNKPVNGFSDYGAGYIGGANFALRGSTSCWNSTNAPTGVLSQSATSAIGANTSVVADSTVSNLAATDANSIMTYVGGTTTNTIRDQMRAMNQSSWTCNN